MPKPGVSEILTVEIERAIQSDWRLILFFFLRDGKPWVSALIHFEGLPWRRN